MSYIMSKEVFEYAHKNTSGEWVGLAVDVALMRDHQALQSENQRLREALKEIMSEVGTSTLAHKIAREAIAKEGDR